MKVRNRKDGRTWTHNVSPSEITMAEQDADYTLVRLNNGTSLRTNGTLDAFNEAIPELIRVNRSYLVNPKQVAAHSTDAENGRLSFLFRNGSILTIGRPQNQKALIAKLEEVW